MDLNNVLNIDLWNEITNTLQRDTSWGWKHVYDENYVSCCRFEKDWVAKIISKEETKDINSDTPVFIISQTGTGKSTYIFESCLPVALEEGKKVLHLSNRLSLTAQMKQRCMEDKLNGQQKVGEILVSNMSEYYTAKFLAYTSEFGGVDVCSYQSFLYNHGKIDASKYAFVILDEAHYFLSDATFNVFTEEVLDLIITKFSNVRRIYLTATPQECIQDIYEKEVQVMRNGSNPYVWMKNCYGRKEFRVYVMDEDYSYLKPYFFKNTEFILDKIKQSSITDYWLVFVRDKETGNKMLRELSGIEGGIEFISADSDKEGEPYLDLINNEKLPKRILISTKVLDAGVNIRTENLHIAVYEDNCVELKQMIGRKRIKKGEHLEVYFFIPEFNLLNNRKGQIEKTLIEQEKNVREKSYYEHGYATKLPYPLYYHHGIRANTFSIKKLRKDKRGYETLLERLKPYNKQDNDYMECYAKSLLEDFPGLTFMPEMLLEGSEQAEKIEEKKNKVNVLMRTWLGKTVSKEELKTFTGQLTEIIGDCRGVLRKDRGLMGIQSMNSALEAYGYKVQSLKSNPVTYRVELRKKEERN